MNIDSRKCQSWLPGTEIFLNGDFTQTKTLVGGTNRRCHRRNTSNVAQNISIQPYLTLLYLGLEGKDKKIRDLLQEHVGATLKFFEIFWTTSNHLLSQSWSISAYLGLSLFIFGNFGLSWSSRSTLGFFGLSLAIMKYQVSGVKQNQERANYCFLKLFGSFPLIFLFSALLKM